METHYWQICQNYQFGTFVKNSNVIGVIHQKSITLLQCPQLTISMQGASIFMDS